ncbi:MAG: YetF domain-containing protein [Bacteroidota bacterium]
MNTLVTIFGEGEDLNTLNMCCRAVVVFILALLMIRISGRRSFGIGTAVDNIIVVLFGAVLSRAVTGTSPFIPTVAASLVIVILHRLMAWRIVHSARLGKLVEGNKILLFENGKMITDNMKRGLVCEEDIMQAIRETTGSEQIDGISKIYIERNGEISVVKNDGVQIAAHRNTAP